MLLTLSGGESREFTPAERIGGSCKGVQIRPTPQWIVITKLEAQTRQKPLAGGVVPINGNGADSGSHAKLFHKRNQQRFGQDEQIGNVAARSGFVHGRNQAVNPSQGMLLHEHG